MKGYGENTLAGSEVDAKMSSSKDVMGGGGALPSSDFIVQRRGAGCRTGSAGYVGTRVVTMSEHSYIPLLPQCGPTGQVVLAVVHLLGVLCK